MTVQQMSRLINLAEVEALIFDLDGVIVDSEPLHAQAKQQSLETFQIAVPASLFEQFKGRPDRVFFEHILSREAGLTVTVEDLERVKHRAYTDLIATLKPIPNVLKFIEVVSQVVPHLALVTSATEHDLQRALNKFGLQQRFEAIVHGDAVKHPKPHPEPYLKALAHLQCPASRCVVIEDSPNGIRAAKAAGCRVIAITTSFDQACLRATKADELVEEFQSLIDRLKEQKR